MSRLLFRVPLLGRSIRHKVMLGVCFCLLGFGGLGGMGYYYLKQMVFTLQLSGNMDDLSADVAEARRIERHYYKFGQAEDHREVLEHVDRAMQRLTDILERVEENRHLEVSRQDKMLLPRLRGDLNAYRALLADLPASGPGKNEAAAQAGWQAGETTRKLVLQLRDDQIAMVEDLQRQLRRAVAALLALTLAGGWMAARRILCALDIIGDATRRIAQGNFTPLSVPHTEEETGQVVSTINQMVAELEKKQHKLEQERKLASLGVLTAGVAHQLNNPLNNIFSTCQLLHEGAQEAAEGVRPPPSMAEVETRMEVVLQEVRRARRIIKGLLDFSRESSFSASPCSLAEVVRQALKLSAQHLPEGTRVYNEVDESITLLLDAQSFQEACINLFINAGEAMAPGGGTIRIRSRKEGDMVELEIADSGEGIAPEHLQKIFDPFFTNKKMGTGLGLSVAFGIIRKHGGCISVDSAPSAGTTFTVRLPLRGGISENGL